MLPYLEIEQRIITKLKNGLSPALTYHNVDHTLDVLQQVQDIAAMEGISDENELLLLKISVLYHDVGFIDMYTGHEERSCEIAGYELRNYGFDEDQISQVLGMIRATKVPQQPQNRLEEIICDADLDYLGRNDFFKIGEGLYKEFIAQGILSDYNEWNKWQIRFLESHYYFTNSSKQRRGQQKQVHLETLKSGAGA